jgi:ubiquitin-activating enzyme E1
MQGGKRKVLADSECTNAPTPSPKSSPALKKAKPMAANADVTMSDVAIDEDLHSRQLAVYGRETMRRLAGAHVLVSGLNAVGVEIGASLNLPRVVRSRPGGGEGDRTSLRGGLRRSLRCRLSASL